MRRPGDDTKGPWQGSIKAESMQLSRTSLNSRSMSQIREQVKSEDKVVKGQSQHQSQSDAAKGFGGKYGVQKERQDKVTVG